jgi:phenylacetate-CoA ligase
MPGEVGRLVCTGLLNTAMPLIRYEVGDRAAIAGPDHQCECGRRLPLLSNMEGRTRDLLIDRDGRWIYSLDPVFYNIPIRESQIVQEAIDRLRVRYVPAPDFTTRHGRDIVDRLRARMGRVEVILEEVEQVPRLPNGKFQSVVRAMDANGLM